MTLAHSISFANTGKMMLPAAFIEETRMNLPKLERSIQRTIDRMGAVPRSVAMTRIGQLLDAGLAQQRLAKVV